MSILKDPLNTLVSMISERPYNGGCGFKGNFGDKVGSGFKIC